MIQEIGTRGYNNKWKMSNIQNYNYNLLEILQYTYCIKSVFVFNQLGLSNLHIKIICARISSFKHNYV